MTRLIKHLFRPIIFNNLSFFPSPSPITGDLQSALHFYGCLTTIGSWSVVITLEVRVSKPVLDFVHLFTLHQVCCIQAVKFSQLNSADLSLYWWTKTSPYSTFSLNAMEFSTFNSHFYALSLSQKQCWSQTATGSVTNISEICCISSKLLSASLKQESCPRQTWSNSPDQDNY